MASAPSDSRDTEVCVAGAGPAGLTLATALAEAGIEVVLLESGTGPAAGPDALDEGEVAGPHLDSLSTSRRRGPGGTAQSWNSWLLRQPAARYIPLDPIDFEARPWIPHSGWPIAASDLAPYYLRARALAGLGAAPPADVYQVGLASVFTTSLPAAIQQNPRIRLETDATLTRLGFDRARGRIASAEWSRRDGSRGEVRAKHFVLALGAVENARRLLLSGVEHDWLGRGFMEHPRDWSLGLVEPTRRLVKAEPFFEITADGPTWGRWGRLAIAESALRSERLLQASATIYPVYAERLRMRKKLRRLFRQPRSRAYRVTINLEQAPDRDNRVTLSSRKDRFDQPLPCLAWRWNPIDEASRVGVRALIRESLETAGFGRVVSTDQAQPDPNAHHHSGTTRMSRDPAEGVVDSTCRVHGVENLYIAGASVFPTAGFANPT